MYRTTHRYKRALPNSSNWVYDHETSMQVTGLAGEFGGFLLNFTVDDIISALPIITNIP